MSCASDMILKRQTVLKRWLICTSYFLSLWCVCACVNERASEREREREWERGSLCLCLLHCACVVYSWGRYKPRVDWPWTIDLCWGITGNESWDNSDLTHKHHPNDSATMQRFVWAEPRLLVTTSAAAATTRRFGVFTFLSTHLTLSRGRNICLQHTGSTFEIISFHNRVFLRISRQTSAYCTVCIVSQQYM